MNMYAANVEGAITLEFGQMRFIDSKSLEVFWRGGFGQLACSFETYFRTERAVWFGIDHKWAQGYFSVEREMPNDFDLEDLHQVKTLFRHRCGQADFLLRFHLNKDFSQSITLSLGACVGYSSARRAEVDGTKVNLSHKEGEVVMNYPLGISYNYFLSYGRPHPDKLILNDWPMD